MSSYVDFHLTAFTRNSTAATACTPNSHSSQGQTAISFCYCNLGYLGHADLPGGTCATCPADSYCIDGNFAAPTGACPASASSLAQSSSVAACTCKAGYFGSAWTGQACTICNKGSYTNAINNLNASLCTSCPSVQPTTYSTFFNVSNALYYLLISAQLFLNSAVVSHRMQKLIG